MSQRRYVEAEPLHKRAFAILEKALGSEHPDVSRALNNLAALYESQGRYAEAEPLFRRSLAIREKALGPALKSFMTKCEKDAKAACDKSAADKKARWRGQGELYHKVRERLRRRLTNRGPDPGRVGTSATMKGGVPPHA